MTDTLLAFGGEIKALGDGRVAGYLVRYTSAETPDLTGDFSPHAAHGMVAQLTVTE